MTAATAMPDFGIELVDIQFQRVNYTASVRKKVFDRMITEIPEAAAPLLPKRWSKLATVTGPPCIWCWSAR